LCARGEEEGLLQGRGHGLDVIPTCCKRIGGRGRIEVQ